MRKIIKLEGLCCANCASKIETEVSKLAGVKSAALSFMTQRLTMESRTTVQTRLWKKAEKLHIR